MQRMAFMIGLLPEKMAEYKRLHAAVWPQVLERLSGRYIRNYTISLREPEGLLFSYWEYHGTDFAEDAATMAADRITQDWWALCGPCQRPLDTRSLGESWAPLEPVFHLD